MKKILTFKLFEQVYLNDIKPFDSGQSYPKGLRFANRDEALSLFQITLHKNILMQDLLIVTNNLKSLHLQKVMA